MDVNLAGRTAIITGASKGIGLAVATRFAASGAEVAIIARGREALDNAVKIIAESGRARVAAIQADVAGAAALPPLPALPGPDAQPGEAARQLATRLVEICSTAISTAQSNRPELRCAFPQLGSMAGYAVTCTADSTTIEIAG